MKYMIIIRTGKEEKTKGVDCSCLHNIKNCLVYVWVDACLFALEVMARLLIQINPRIVKEK